MTEQLEVWMLDGMGENLKIVKRLKSDFNFPLDKPAWNTFNEAKNYVLEVLTFQIKGIEIQLKGLQYLAQRVKQMKEPNE